MHPGLGATDFDDDLQQDEAAAEEEPTHVGRTSHAAVTSSSSCNPMSEGRVSDNCRQSTAGAHPFVFIFLCGLSKVQSYRAMLPGRAKLITV